MDGLLELRRDRVVLGCHGRGEFPLELCVTLRELCDGGGKRRHGARRRDRSDELAVHVHTSRRDTDDALTLLDRRLLERSPDEPDRCLRCSRCLCGQLGGCFRGRFRGHLQLGGCGNSCGVGCGAAHEHLARARGRCPVPTNPRRHLQHSHPGHRNAPNAHNHIRRSKARKLCVAAWVDRADHVALGDRKTHPDAHGHRRHRQRYQSFVLVLILVLGRLAHYHDALGCLHLGRVSAHGARDGQLVHALGDSQLVDGDEQVAREEASLLADGARVRLVDVEVVRNGYAELVGRHQRRQL